jgi:hypothetical protein
MHDCYKSRALVVYVCGESARRTPSAACGLIDTVIGSGLVQVPADRPDFPPPSLEVESRSDGGRGQIEHRSGGMRRREKQLRPSRMSQAGRVLPRCASVHPRTPNPRTKEPWSWNFPDSIASQPPGRLSLCRVGRPKSPSPNVHQSSFNHEEPRSGPPGQFRTQPIGAIRVAACAPPATSGRPLTHGTPDARADEVVQRGLVPSIAATPGGRSLREAAWQPPTTRSGLHTRANDPVVVPERVEAVWDTDREAPDQRESYRAARSRRLRVLKPRLGVVS